MKLVLLLLLKNYHQDCATGKFNAPEISTGKDSITAIVEIQTPTPCYNITGTVKIYKGKININLVPVRQNKICIQCVGKVITEVTVKNLRSGSYDVAIAVPKESWVFNVNVSE
ncbi:hypothetical protein BMS3Bbin15_00285 [archaeon BMS3Bbin15]|nr:hypothetical protein BMS3Bbin15_00285 [archaeon BMS3Bbin15]